MKTLITDFHQIGIESAWLENQFKIRSNAPYSLATSVNKIPDYDAAFISTTKDRINPEFYGDKKIDELFYPKSSRDDQIRSKFNLMKDAIKKGKKIIAVGNSAAIACIMAGGKVIQEIDGHYEFHKSRNDEPNEEFRHRIYLADGSGNNPKGVLVPSSHADCMFPFNIRREDYSIIAWAAGLSTLDNSSTIPKVDPKIAYRNANEELIPPTEEQFFGKHPAFDNRYRIEPEIVYFRNINTLAIQSKPHVLFRNIKYDAGQRVVLSIVDYFLKDKL